jgi:predicted nucleic acid-binding protein
MATTLVDTSVWVDFFKGVSATHVEALDRLVETGNAAVCGVVLCELLPMGHTASERNETEEYFASIRLLDDPPALWNSVLDIKKRCRSAGVSGIGVADYIIAAVAQHNKVKVLSADAHFRLIGKGLPGILAA